LEEQIKKKAWIHGYSKVGLLMSLEDIPYQKPPTIPMILLREGGEYTLSKNQLKELLEEYTDPYGNRISVEIHNPIFNRVVDLIAELILKTKLKMKKPIYFMRCCLLLWFGIQPDPCAHFIDDKFKRFIDFKYMIEDGLNRTHYYGYEGITRQQRLKIKLDKEFEESFWHKNSSWNPDFGEIVEAYTPYLK
jgi:hypothetical protein